MSKHIPLVQTVISTALALSVTAFASNAFAAHENEEQCAGVIKAGKNDCATSRNQCHGHVATDSDAMAWIYLPKGTCDRIANAHLVQASDPTPVK